MSARREETDRCATAGFRNESRPIVNGKPDCYTKTTESTLQQSGNGWGIMREEIQVSGLDQIDNMIIRMLRENARLTFSEIGKTAGISRVAAKHRIEQLEKNGVIKGYHADIDLRAMPKGIRFTLDIEAAPGY